MITAQNLRMHELIGLYARVAGGKSKTHVGLQGVVVDETKNTFVLCCGGVEKTVPKRGNVFVFSIPGGKKVRIDGSEIAFRPYDRPKKLR